MENKRIKSLLVFVSFSFILLSCLPSKRNENEKNIKIGENYADVVNGISFIKNDSDAFLFRVGWKDEKNEYKYSYNDIKNSKMNLGNASPDQSYNCVSWEANGANITFEWAEIKGKGAIGKVTASRGISIAFETLPAWKKFQSFYSIHGDSICGESNNKINWFLKTNAKPAGEIASDDEITAIHKKIVNNESNVKPRSLHAVLQFKATADEPIYFVAGFSGFDYDFKSIDTTLSLNKNEYLSMNCSVSGDWGNFMEPVFNHLNHTRIYGVNSQMTAYTTARGWCKTDDLAIYEWDSFFHALLGSIEDPEQGKNTIRLLLQFQQPCGLIPNTNFQGEQSIDRSQPPVGALCVWKMHQYHPDLDFLKEVYPKLVKHHDWWFAKRPSNGLPYRDGNNNGLLEWGTETGDLQNAKYESGEDNSPMFDDVIMNEKSKTIEMDMVDLSALWAADAMYLSLIAKEIGKTEDIKRFDLEKEQMNKRINKFLWNEKTGIYCNRYWSEYSRNPKLNQFKPISSSYFASNSSKQGQIEMKYFDGKDTLKKSVQKIMLNDKDAKQFFEQKTKIVWEGKIKTDRSTRYFFYTNQEDGVRLWVNNILIIDNLAMWVTQFISTPITLEAGKQYTIRLEYSERKAFELLLSPEVKIPDNDLFSERVAINNLYPLISLAPNQERAARMLAFLKDTTKFWGEYVCPTITRDDPSFPSQGYWRGRIWPPTNYLLYQGLKHYADQQMRFEFAKKSAKLNVESWKKDYTMYENYYASGLGAGDSHYCWGGLLSLIALEELCDFNFEGQEVLNPYIKGTFEIRNLPIKGKLHTISYKDGKSSMN